MFKQVWKKYIPVITILMKRSVKEEQTLNMNHTDFERAAGGRKVKFSFNDIALHKGYPDYSAKLTPLANDLILVLREEELTDKLVRNMDIGISMNNSFQLTIKNLKSTAEADVKITSDNDND